MLPPFTIVRPTTLADACAVLAENPDAAAYAGGTELVVAMKLGLADYTLLVDLKPLPELAGIVADAGNLRIGATATHREIARSAATAAAFPALAAALRHVANPRVRNTGTIGGNLAFGEPHSDPATLLVAADARFHCQDATGAVRGVAAADFLEAPFQTCLRPGELITSVEVPPFDPAGSAVGFRRFVLTERAAAIAAVRVDAPAGLVTGARVVVGAATPRPARVDAAERLVVGRPVTDDDRATWRVVGEAAAQAAAVDARDAGVAEDYLRHLVSVLVADALGDAVTALRRPAAPGPAAHPPVTPDPATPDSATPQPVARHRWLWRRR